MKDLTESKILDAIEFLCQHSNISEGNLPDFRRVTAGLFELLRQTKETENAHP
jgi:hypothetical protein